MQEEQFAEYHLYSMERRTTIKQNQTKQVSLLRAAGARVSKSYEFRGSGLYYSQPQPPVNSEKVDVYLQFNNAEDNGLGMPIPAGIMRVYQQDGDGMMQFSGEDRVKHTPRDEKIRLRLGSAFDLTGERVQTDFQNVVGRGTRGVHESAYTITLRNHKEAEVTIDVVESMPGDWEIIESSHPHLKKDAQTAVFSIPVAADGAAQLTYRVRVAL